MARRKHNIEHRIKAVSDRIKSRRLRHTDLTQEAIAEELGIHVTSYGRLENGGAELTITKAMDLARYYGITIDELVGYSLEDDNPPIVQEEMLPYGQKPTNIVFQIGGGQDNSPEAERFLSRLGKMLMEDFKPDQSEDS
jgi:transcriptional regulator with XRE-family HTH domain